MLRNSELWMFSCQVRNQSVEKGSWPLEGDLPAISLYRRIRRSYDSVVSDSSTCMRAPIWISIAARSICFDSFSTLLAGALAVDLAAVVVMAGAFRKQGKRAGRRGRSEHFRHAAGHQDVGVQRVGGLVAHLLGDVVVGQQAPDQVVIHAERAQQGVARRQLHHLG